MKKIILAFLLCTLYFVPCTCFSQANTYFHDRIDTTIFAVTDTVGHGANNYYATNLTPDFNVKQYENGLSVLLFIKKGNTGPATLTLVTKTATLATRPIRKGSGQLLSTGDLKDSTTALFTYYNGSWRLGDLLSASTTSWMLLGNAGTVAGTNFIGTTDSIDFVFKVNNRERGRINRNGGSWTLGATSVTQGKLIMKGLTSGSVTVTSAAAAGSWTLTLPIDDGTLSQFLQTDGTGITSWQTVTPATIGAWSITGNSGTIAGTNFLGTTDSVDLVFKTNGIERMRLIRQGSIGGLGIGITTPTAQLHIKGIGATSATFGFKYDNSSSSPILYGRDDGNIGIGTSTPSTTLEINGQTTLSGGVTGASPSPRILMGSYFDNAGAASVSHLALLGTSVGFGVSTNSLDYFGADSHTFYTSGGTMIAEIHSSGWLEIPTAITVNSSSSSADLAVKSISATGTHQIFEIKDNSNNVLLQIFQNGVFYSPNLQTFANNAAALAGGLLPGDWYLVSDVVTGSKIIEIVQ